MNIIGDDYIIFTIIFSIIIFLFIKLPKTLSSTIKSYTHLKETFNKEEMKDVHIFESIGMLIQNTNLGRIRTTPHIDKELFKTTLHLTDHYSDDSNYDISINNITEIYNDPLIIIFQTELKANQIYRLERTFFLTHRPNDKIILSEKLMSTNNVIFSNLHEVKLNYLGDWNIQTTLIESKNHKEIIIWNTLNTIQNYFGIDDEYFSDIPLSRCFINNFSENAWNTDSLLHFKDPSSALLARTTL